MGCRPRAPGRARLPTTGELDTIGLLAFGLALRGEGWRITYLGADTPLAAIEQNAGAV